MAVPCYFVGMNPWPLLLFSCGLFLSAGCSDPSPAPGSSDADRQPERNSETSGIPACWTVPAKEAASAQWTHFAAVDRLDASLRATVHGQLMHLCWAEGGACPGDTTLFPFFRDVLGDFTAIALPAIPSDAAGTAAIRMGPAMATDSGITVDAAAFIWTGEETVLSRRYVLDAASGKWAVLDGQGVQEEAAYALIHASMPFLDMEWAWPQTDIAQETFASRIVPALTRGIFSGGVSREIRVTPLDSAHWGWEIVNDFYGCGAPHGWVEHAGHLFDPRQPIDPNQTAPEPLSTDWNSPSANTALADMRSLLRAYYIHQADNGCGNEGDLDWAEQGDVTPGLHLCARPGPGGELIPTLFNQGDPPMANRSNGYCTPRLHLDLSRTAFEDMVP